MPDPTASDELHAAATRLRYLLHPDGIPEQIRANWTQLPYPEKQGVITIPSEDTPVLMAFWGGITEYLTAVQPSVGATLADWLEWEAATVSSTAWARENRGLDCALAVARAINATTE